MKTEYFVTYGCYINMSASKVVVEHPADATLEKLEAFMEKELYYLASTDTEGWVGSHGFDFEEDEGATEDENNEYFCIFIDEASSWTFELWNHKDHAPKCTYGHSTEPSTENWKYYEVKD